MMRISRWMRGLTISAACVAVMLAGCKRDDSTPPKTTAGSAETVAKSKSEVPTAPKPASGRDVLRQMVEAYHKASTYADAGTVRLVAEADGRKVVDETGNFSCTLVRPNKVRMQAYDTMLVCDGEKLFAAIGWLPGQVVVKSAPAAITMDRLVADPVLAEGLRRGFGGGMPQPVLLLNDDPLSVLLPEKAEPTMMEPGQIEGRDCYRVRIDWPEGLVTLWIDQQTHVLRRLVLPTDDLRREMSRERAVDSVSLVAEFTGARIDGKIDPKAFRYEVPKGVDVVKFFVPPNPAQLLGKPSPDFKFSDLDGKPVSRESLAGKVVVLDFWATYCGPCRETLPRLDQVYARFKNNPKVAILAVSVDDSQVENKAIVEAFAQLKVGVPTLRDLDGSARLFHLGGVPTLILLGPDGVVQDCEIGGNPKLVEQLPAKIEKLLAGENIFEKPLRAYEDELKERARQIDQEPPSRPASNSGENEKDMSIEQSLPEPKIAPRSEPTAMKLSPLWKCGEVKAPGNIAVAAVPGAPARLLVVDDFAAIAEVGFDGKLIARHDLKLAEGESIGNLRVATGADGKSCVAAFLIGQQRCHVFDEKWNHVVSYPDDALAHPHGGLGDVRLGDLDGDGTLRLYVGFLDVVGVQCAGLDGKRLWSNRSISRVFDLALGEPDAKGRRELFCTNTNGSLVAIDSQGDRDSEFFAPGRKLGWIATAGLRGEGPWLWCGLSSVRLGEDVAVGLMLDGKALRQTWEYALPQGLQSRPIERIVPGRVTRDGPGQWIIPGPDGSLHILAADGKPLDKFGYGALLDGVVTVDIDGRPALVVASRQGLEAWKVDETTAN